MVIDKNYIPATLYVKKQGSGYFFCVNFSIRNNPDDKWQRVRKTYDLNRIEDINERRLAGSIIVKALNEALDKGWHPAEETITNPSKTPEKTAPSKEVEEVKEEPQKSLTTLIEIANKAILFKTTSIRTINSYNSHKKLFTEYLNFKKLNKIGGNSFSNTHALDYAHWLKNDKEYQPKTINTKIGYISEVFKKLNALKFISHNPFDVVDSIILKEKDNTDQLFTLQDLEKIKAYCNEQFPELWQYYLFIHYCFMRPDSISKIQLQHIDFKSKTIRISGEFHKNGKNVKKQLLGAHLKYLQPFVKDLLNSGTPENYYLFGKNMKPGSKSWASTRYAELWRTHIKLNLGINKNAYHGKHTGGTLFIDNAHGEENLKWLSMQMSHADLQTTAIYVHNKKNVTLEDESNIIEL